MIITNTTAVSLRYRGADDEFGLNVGEPFQERNRFRTGSLSVYGNTRHVRNVRGRERNADGPNFVINRPEQTGNERL